MDLALTVTLVIPRPFTYPVGNRGLARMTAPITRPCIRREPPALGGDVVSHQGAAGAPVGMVAHPPARLARVARDDPDEGRASIRRRPMPLALVGTAPGWSGRVRGRRAGLPPWCGTVRRPRRPSRASPRSGRSRAGALEDAAAACAAVAVTAPMRGRGAPWTRPWQDPVPAPPASPVAAALGEDRPRQQRRVAIAGPTTGGGKGALRTEHASRRAAAARAVQAVRVEVPLQPCEGSAIVE